MFEPHDLPHSTTVPDFGLTPRSTAHPNHIDATRRWQDSQQTMLQLMTTAPSLGISLAGVLKQQWDLDSDQVGLLFPANAQRSSRRCSLTQASAFVLHHPDLDPRLVAECRITGLDRSHRFFSTSVPQLLHDLQQLGLQQRFRIDWNTYWNDRASGSPFSRRSVAAELYRTHFEVACEAGFADGALTAEQLPWLLALLEPVNQPSAPSNHRLSVEQLAMQHGDERQATLPGIMAFNSNGDGSEQWLYMPTHWPALMRFTQRSELAEWLIGHQHDIPWNGADVGYGVIADMAPGDPLEAGVTQLLEHLCEARLQKPAASGDDLAEHAAYALLAPQRAGNNSVFAAPPAPPNTDLTLDDAALDADFSFGSPGDDQPLPMRQAALKQQRDALDHLLGQDYQGDPDDPRLSDLKAHLDKLDQAQQAAMSAAYALLNRTRVFDMSTIDTHYTALYHARVKGLSAEAAIQCKLAQISSDEYRLIEAVLDTPKSAERLGTAVVASLALSAVEPGSPGATTHHQELEGPLVFTRKAALQDPASSQSLLLYWPGMGGGLHRCASRQELERSLFNISAHSADTALHLKELTTDAVDYALRKQVSTFERRAAERRQQLPIDVQAEQLTDALGELREQTLATLLVPEHAMRDMAYAHLIEQNHSSVLTRNLPDWFVRSAVHDRLQLEPLIQAYILALQNAQQLHEFSLPLVSEFASKRIDARLRTDFSLEQPFSVQLDLPDTVTTQQHFFEAPGAPGTPTKTVWIASQERSKLSLAQLALLNIDDDVAERLRFMRVEISADNPAERDRLKSGVTLPYLTALVTGLDLAQQYEDLIRSTYRGVSTASKFQQECRRERLLEPYRLMLKIHGHIARLRGELDAGELQILNIATDAATPAAWSADGMRIVLRAAYLSAGGKDTGDQATTLSGITFIEEQVRGVTLLYLPDSPDRIFLRRYDTLEHARKALFDLCLNQQMVNYLADRALIGNAPNHVVRINQALLKNFDAMIAVGVAWPNTTSMAAHLLDAEMGRLIVAHQNTSRSNSELFLEQYAVKGEKALTYMKMAIGIIPVIGTGVGLYDAWTSANQAVAAFRKGEHVQAMAEITSLLQALADAAFDLVSGIGLRVSAARTRILQRQLLDAFNHPTRSPPLISARKVRHIAARFTGYTYEKNLSLAGLQADTHGLYRNVYRHPDGNFIVRNASAYKVELQDGGWRLSPTRFKTYKQPIALDASGQWDTYFAVHGKTLNGGLAGGGGVQSSLADRLDPLWPTAIRQYLPRWWTDRVFRRQQTLAASCDARTLELNRQSRQTNEVLERFQKSDPRTQAALHPQLDAASVQEIALGKNLYRELEELSSLSRGNRRTEIRDMQSRTAWLITDRSLHRVRFSARRISARLEDIEDLAIQAEAMSPTNYDAVLNLLQKRKVVRGQIVKELEIIDEASAQFDDWSNRISNASQRKAVMGEKAKLHGLLLEENRLFMKTSQYLQTVSQFSRVDDVSWFYLQSQMFDARNRIDRVLTTQHHLAQVNPTRTQYNRILETSIEAYDQFRQELTAWTTSYPNHFDLAVVPMLLDNLEKTAARASQLIRQPMPTRRPAGALTQRIFETEQGQLLIGNVTAGHESLSLVGIDGFSENWLPAQQGRYRLQATPPRFAAQPVPSNIGVLLSEAKKRLEAVALYEQKVETYARQNMLPVNLEHMMLSEAAELRLRAQQIGTRAPQDEIIGQLHNKAIELTDKGRQLRIQSSMSSKTPTIGYLDYLMDKQAISIRKHGTPVEQPRLADGRPDFLQEFEVRDLTHTPPRTLWWAHFHYNSATPLQVENFTKAHLKLPEQRRLGLQWQQGQAAAGNEVDSIYRGPITIPYAIKHFKHL
jgi:hypothetical protein